MKSWFGFRGFFIMMLCVVILLTACDAGEKLQGEQPIRIMEVDAAELQDPVDGEEDEVAGMVAGGANDFALRLSAALVQDVGEKNFVCSPYSVWLPLAALVNATDEQNKPALTEALGAAGIAEGDINRAASRMLYDLMEVRRNQDAEEYGMEQVDPLRIVNGIFVDDEEVLQEDFVQSFADYYRGSVINVDFADQEAVDEINRWASENTEGLINDVVDRFDPETVAAIVNSLYFSDGWEDEFWPQFTEEEVFYGAAGEGTASFMYKDAMLPYYEDSELQAVTLDFVLGGSLMILLPKESEAADSEDFGAVSANDCLASLTGERFREIVELTEDTGGMLLLPRFKVENQVNHLKDALVSLGIPLFDKEAAALTGLIEGDGEVWVSEATQKALIEVDEKGATAAAVTVIEVAETAAMIDMGATRFEMNCNRPFVFVLYENTYDGGEQILFTGVVNQL